jgi:hypothetical protein
MKWAGLWRCLTNGNLKLSKNESRLTSRVVRELIEGLSGVGTANPIFVPIRSFPEN